MEAKTQTRLYSVVRYVRAREYALSLKTPRAQIRNLNVAADIYASLSKREQKLARIMSR
jgi:hypothetical protein